MDRETKWFLCLVAFFAIATFIGIHYAVKEREQYTINCNAKGGAVIETEDKLYCVKPEALL